MFPNQGFLPFMMLQQVAGGDGPGPGWGNRPPGNFMPRGGGPMMGGRGIPPMRGGGPPMMRGMGAPMMRGGVPPMGSPFQQRAMLMQQQQGGFPRGGNMGGPFQPRGPMTNALMHPRGFGPRTPFRPPVNNTSQTPEKPPLPPTPSSSSSSSTPAASATSSSSSSQTKDKLPAPVGAIKKPAENKSEKKAEEPKESPVPEVSKQAPPPPPPISERKMTPPPSTSSKSSEEQKKSGDAKVPGSQEGGSNVQKNSDLSEGLKSVSESKQGSNFNSGPSKGGPNSNFGARDSPTFNARPGQGSNFNAGPSQGPNFNAEPGKGPNFNAGAGKGPFLGHGPSSSAGRGPFNAKPVDEGMMSPMERQFNEMFEKWDKEFEDWKIQNVDNPDREYVVNQLREMNTMREKMLKRRNVLKQQRIGKHEMENAERRRKGLPPINQDSGFGRDSKQPGSGGPGDSQPASGGSGPSGGLGPNGGPGPNRNNPDCSGPPFGRNNSGPNMNFGLKPGPNNSSPGFKEGRSGDFDNQGNFGALHTGPDHSDRNQRNEPYSKLGPSNFQDNNRNFGGRDNFGQPGHGPELGRNQGGPPPGPSFGREGGPGNWPNNRENPGPDSNLGGPPAPPNLEKEQGRGPSLEKNRNSADLRGPPGPNFGRNQGGPPPGPSFGRNSAPGDGPNKRGNQGPDSNLGGRPGHPNFERDQGHGHDFERNINNDSEFGGPRGPNFVRNQSPGPNFEKNQNHYSDFRGPQRPYIPEGEGPGPNFDRNQGPNPNFQGPRGPNFDGHPGPNFHGPPRPHFDGPPRPHFDGPPRPNLDGPPGPNFDGPPRPNFDGPPPGPNFGAPGPNFGRDQGQGPNFARNQNQGPDYERSQGPIFGRNQGSGPNFEGNQGPNFQRSDGPPGPNFGQNQGSGPNFGRNQGPGSDFERPPAPNFQRGDGPGPNFGRNQGPGINFGRSQGPGFNSGRNQGFDNEGPPEPNFQRGGDEGPNFEGNQGHRPRFEGPPRDWESGPNFDGPPRDWESGPNYDGLPGNRESGPNFGMNQGPGSNFGQNKEPGSNFGGPSGPDPQRNQGPVGGFGGPPEPDFNRAQGPGPNFRNNRGPESSQGGPPGGNFSGDRVQGSNFGGPSGPNFQGDRPEANFSRGQEGPGFGPRPERSNFQLDQDLPDQGHSSGFRKDFLPPKRGEPERHGNQGPNFRGDSQGSNYNRDSAGHGSSREPEGPGNFRRDPQQSSSNFGQSFRNEDDWQRGGGNQLPSSEFNRGFADESRNPRPSTSMTSFMGSSRKDIPGIAAADSSDSQKGGDVNELSAKDRASISRLVSGLDDDDDEDQPPRGGFRPSRSSDSDRRDWDSNRDGYSWSQRRENKPAPPLPPPPPRAQDQSLFKRKNEIELSAQHEMEELFQKRPPKRDEDFWNPTHDVIEYIPPSPKIPKVIDYGHNQGSDDPVAAQASKPSTSGGRSTWGRDMDDSSPSYGSRANRPDSHNRDPYSEERRRQHHGDDRHHPRDNQDRMRSWGDGDSRHSSFSQDRDRGEPRRIPDPPIPTEQQLREGGRFSGGREGEQNRRGEFRDPMDCDRWEDLKKLDHQNLRSNSDGFSRGGGGGRGGYRDERESYRERGDDRDSRRPRDDRRSDGYSADRHRSRSPIPPPPRSASKQSPPSQPAAIIGETLSLEDLLEPPGRYIRPPKIVIILRGLPGSGKSFVAKNLKAKEADMSSETPRILSIDDYFEVDGEYEYDEAMMKSYSASLTKNFKKQIENGLFSFLIVDNINDKNAHYEEMWSFAKLKGYEVYIAEIDCDPNLCVTRNIHKRTDSEINKLFKGWEPTPSHFLKMDLRNFLQGKEIDHVEMEDAEDEDSNKAKAASKTKGSDEVMYVGPYDSAPSTSRRGGYDGDDAGPSSRYRRPEGHEQNYGDRFHDRMTSNRDYD